MQAGELIAGRYRLDHLLGQGGMGSVWAATHEITKKRIALKFLLPALPLTPTTIHRFVREAKAASAVEHPNVVPIHEVLRLRDGTPFMVMDLLEGEPFRKRLAAVKQLDTPALATILLPVLSALGHLHAEGIVHRDLKPENIFLERQLGGREVSRVLDFGLAKGFEGTLQSIELTGSGEVMGTIAYMAPEQLSGEKDVDQRVDVWAVGVIIYEALAGRRPFPDDNVVQLVMAMTTGGVQPLEEVVVDVPQDVARLVNRLLQQDRTQRSEDLQEAFEIFRTYSSIDTPGFPSKRPSLIVRAKVDEPVDQTSPTVDATPPQGPPDGILDSTSPTTNPPASPSTGGFRALYAGLGAVAVGAIAVAYQWTMSRGPEPAEADMVEMAEPVLSEQRSSLAQAEEELAHPENTPLQADSGKLAVESATSAAAKPASALPSVRERLSKPPTPKPQRPSPGVDPQPSSPASPSAAILGARQPAVGAASTSASSAAAETPVDPAPTATKEPPNISGIYRQDPF